jgi:glycosyltransferase involved in cell wall biosynthesis
MENRGSSRLKQAAARLLIPDRDVLWALSAARAVRRLAPRFDVVLTTAPPFSTHLIGGWLALTRARTPWVAEYRDNWTMNPLYRRHGIRALIERRIEGALVRRATGIVVISSAAADEMLAAFPRGQGRVHVVANGFDPDDLPTPRARAREFEIAYTGSLDIRRDPRPLLGALGRLANEDAEFGADLRLRLIGNVAPWVHDAARRELGDERVISAGLLSHREALAQAADAAVLLVITTRGESGAAGMTSKLPEYLGLRRPVLMLAPPGPGRELVIRLQAGMAAEPDDVEGIRTAIRQLHQDWQTGRERIADPASLARLTRRESARQMARVLDCARRRRHST